MDAITKKKAEGFDRLANLLKTHRQITLIDQIAGVEIYLGNQYTHGYTHENLLGLANGIPKNEG